MIRELKGQQFFFTIISSKRPHNVEKMTRLVGDATWVIPEDQIEDYLEAGAPETMIAGGGLSYARNNALETAFADNLICMQMDDDLSKMSRAIDGEAVDIPAEEAMGDMLQRLILSDFYLAGASPTANPYFISKMNSTNLFIIGSMIAVKPSEPRFDTDLILKEDYDFTLQHIIQYGGVQRCDDILPTFLHYTNKGGCEDFRTERLEEEACQILLDKYPGMIKRHPRREREVLLNIKKNFRLQ